MLQFMRLVLGCVILKRLKRTIVVSSPSRATRYMYLNKIISIFLALVLMKASMREVVLSLATQHTHRGSRWIFSDTSSQPMNSIWPQPQYIDEEK